MYVGKIVWNRQRFVKDPDPGKRQAQPNSESESEWVIQEAPELRILDDVLWNAVKAGRARTASSGIRPLLLFVHSGDEPPAHGRPRRYRRG